MSTVNVQDVRAVSHVKTEELVSMQKRSFDPLEHLPEDLVLRIVTKMKLQEWYTPSQNGPAARGLSTFRSCLLGQLC